MAGKKPLLQALAGQMSERLPFWFMRQAGRYLPEYRELRGEAGSFLDLCYTPELACEVTLQPIRRFSMDAAILFADILLIPDGLGQELRYIEGEGPQLTPVRCREDVAALRLERVNEHVAPVFETIRRVAAALPQEAALIGFAGAPWTVACYMVEGGGSRDFAHTKRWAFGDPDGFQILIDLLVEASVAYLAAQVRAGCEVVQIFDTWAGLLPEAAFQRWCVAPTARIVEALRADFPELPVIGFPRGAGAGYGPYSERTGVTAVSLDAAVALPWAREELPNRIVVQGNLDPQWLVVGGERMLAESRRILEAFEGRPSIFNLGHGIVPETPVEHVAELSELLRRGRQGSSAP